MSAVSVLTVVGARPQFVKAAPVCAALDAAGIAGTVVHTGQHFDDEMSRVFFDELSLPKPDIDLQIHGGGHGQMTGRMVEALEEVLIERTPDWVLVYGDTNSTLAAAIAASKLHGLRLAHVEAGLRSFNRQMPEEVNRVVTDHLSNLCLTPTETADANLRLEGISAERVIRTGDVMFDAILRFQGLSDERSDVLERWHLRAGEFILATVHRAENTDDVGRLRAIVGGLAEVAEHVPVVLPVHPRTAGVLSTAAVDTGSIVLLPPVGYLDMLALERHSRLVATDSGGVQKEAFFLGRSCVTLRNETEWVELVELGWNRLLPPTGVSTVREGVLAALEAGPGSPVQPYGAGDAAERIVAALAGA